MANLLTISSTNAQRVASEANQIRDDINNILDGINSLSNIPGAVSGAGSLVNNVANVGGDIAADPKSALQHLMNYGIEELRNKVFEEILQPLIGRYLLNGGMNGNDYLESVGVVRTNRSGLDAVGIRALEFYKITNLGLGNSILIDHDGNINVTVEYEIIYMFGVLPLPFRPTLRVTQSVITKAWLNGSGEGYVR
jgi:hypothetical protein